MNSYTKIVKVKEFEFYCQAECLKISPLLISHCTDGEFIKMCVEKYPHTLQDLIEGGITKQYLAEILQKAHICLDKLHEIGIIHGDLSEENIVVGKDIRLIDFGMSYTKESVTPENIKEIAEEFYEGENYADNNLTGFEYIKSLENGVLVFLYNFCKTID